jgi:hypothetical protein
MPVETVPVETVPVTTVPVETVPAETRTSPADSVATEPVVPSATATTAVLPVEAPE